MYFFTACKISALLFSWDFGCIAYLEYPPSALVLCGKSRSEKPGSTKETGVLQLDWKKGRELPGPHPRGISSFWRSQIRELPAVCFPPPFPIGWGTSKVQPSRTTYHIRWTCMVIFLFQKLKLSGFCSKLERFNVGADPHTRSSAPNCFFRPSR